MQIELPSKDTAETIEHLVTAAGIVLAGAWAFWRWSLSEFIRRRREIPSFDGAMSARSVSMDQTRDILSVSCVWHNKSAVPLPVNTKETRFAVYELPEAVSEGPVGPRMKNLVERFVRKPWEHWGEVVMEPGTSSELQAHFVLPAHRPYIILCRLEATRKRDEEKRVWVRELLWQSGHDREPELTPNPSVEPTATGNPVAAAHA